MPKTDKQRDLTPYLAKLEEKRLELAGYLQSLAAGLEISHVAEAEESTVLASSRESVAEEIRRTRRMLANVDWAIERGKLGAFGRCNRCGKEISDKRLAAIPEAPRCLPCAVEEVLR